MNYKKTFSLFLTSLWLQGDIVVLANNTSYITLSNQIARKRQLETVANNVANADTIGYEQDDLLFRKVDKRQNAKRANSFVWAETTFKSGDTGGLRMTSRPTDIAIGGKGYFKVLTPRGDRYTLDGSMSISSDNLLVNFNGYPYSSQDGEPIEIPDTYRSFYVAQDGRVYVDDEEVGIIGVFDFVETDPLIKEGTRLYKSGGSEIAAENVTVIAGALRTSNVNSTLAMAKMVEMQRAVGTTNNLMSDVSDLERAVITKAGTAK